MKRVRLARIAPRVLLLVGVIAAVLLASAFYARYGGETPAGESQAAATGAVKKSPAPAYKNLLDRIFSRGRCQGMGTTTLTASPMRPEDILIFIPLGQMVKGHVTPVDHQYLYPTGWRSGAAEVPIVAPADGYIVMVNRYPEQQIESHLGARDGYDIVIEHSCEFYTKLGLLTSIPGDLAKKIGPVAKGKQKYVRVPVKAGQAVAGIEGQSLDLYTYDIRTPRKQWVVPAHYNEGEGEKKYITDALLYMKTALRTKLLAKNPRTAEPRGGRFDYDIDGRLAGAWFLKGSGGYFPGPTVQNYWKNHIVFAYNELDPSSLEVSVGTWDGDDTGHQFAVVGNRPDPKDVSVASGIVKYELAPAMFTAAGQPWDQVTYAGPVHRSAVHELAGTLLVQMTSDRQIKVEAFPGKTPAEVQGFTLAARLYER